MFGHFYNEKTPNFHPISEILREVLYLDIKDEAIIYH